MVVFADGDRADYRMNVRMAIVGLVALFIMTAFLQGGHPYRRAEHAYGYTWEHSLTEWAVITANNREHPRMCQIYNWANFPGPQWHEERAWVWVPCE